MKIRNKKLLTKSIAMAIFMSSTLYTMPITYAAFNNNTLPSGGSVVAGQVVINDPDKANIINQTSSNAVIQWKDFSIGANATVNFKGPENFNTLNYVNGGNLSQIYGTINADKGNIYIVNPAGVQIGNSAQINVGSLYVSNKNLDTPLENIDKKNPDINSILGNGTASPNAELMSLGNINATNVTFDGNRIVLDVDRVKNGQTPLGADNITIKTTKKDFDNKDVVLGYTAYDDRDGYKYTNDKNNSSTQLAKLILDDNTTKYITKKDGFMWVKDGEQLQAMNTNLGGNYAFRNSIDLNSINNFNSIENFEGNLDGLGYEVYGLHSKNNGLFKNTSNSIIRNFNLISGSINGTTDNVGAVVGNANSTVIENVKNTINVTGTNNVGGIIGTGTDVTLNGVVNAGAIKGNSNVGGLAGNLAGSTLEGESYNLGDIKGTANNIGGLVGSASNSTIGNETGFQMYNHLDVTGGYNVGGIVGNLEDGSTVQNVNNDGTIKATDKIESEYNYHTGKSGDLPNNATFENGIATVTVDIANVGGIVGNSDGNTKANTINNVLNNGDISSNKQSNNDYYDAGNVGGVVGSAVNTNITDATNKENDVRGAHNVGGIAGYFEEGTISNAINNGGDILATGARHNGDFIKESVRNSENTKEEFNIGNMGGIVGYMFGDASYVELSANRGTVHSAEIENFGSVQEPSKAANTGGIVGKIDRGTTLNLTNINDKDAPKKAAVSNSYNTGNVSGYTGVGGVVGMMYNGEVINSYNLGNIQTTRQVQSNEKIPAVNMGGVVGDTTENSGAQALIYNVYNKGQIGDENFNYYARHVGGVVGRLSGTVEKAYNNGAIYNGYSVVGGIVGWWSTGNMSNVFNTGNITVVNNDTKNIRGSEVGGIVGGIYNGVTKLNNAYNLGTLRSFVNNGVNAHNSLGGIIGNIHDTNNGRKEIKIEDVYTLGNLYVNNKNGNADYINSIYGQYEDDTDNINNNKVTINNAYYIQPGNSSFTDLNNSGTNQHTKAILYSDRTNENNYTFSNENDWRIYNGINGTTPILNVFMPETNGKFDGENSALTSGSITNVQYGTAYDPLLTIVNTNSDITLDWQKLGIYGDAGLAVYGGNLTLNNFKNSDKGVGLFGGIIYSDGVLNINSAGDNIGLGNFSKLYGSAININADKGTVDAYGSIISTGNNNTEGNIKITGANVNTYGEIKTAVGSQTTTTTTIDGIGNTVVNDYNNKFTNVEDPNAKMPDVAEGYAHTVTAGANSTGDVSISATNGDVNIYYGNMENGIIDTQGDVELKGNNVYVDSDMVIGGNLTTTASSAGEIVLDISNIGKVSLKQYTNNLYKALVANDRNLNSADSIKDIIKSLETKIDLNDDQLTAFAEYLHDNYIINGKLKDEATESAISDAIIKGRMHNFLKSFSDNKSINFKGTDNAKITVDLWDGSKFNLKKYDQGGNTLSEELSNLNIKDKDDNPLSGREVTYIWVADGEQLKGIQNYANEDKDSNILSYNFALKNDINATDVSDYQAIGSGDTAFTGKFDGRGNRIIGLNVNNVNPNGNTSTDNVGVFGVNAGTIKNLKVYSSTFKGYDNVGAIAGTNNGTIDNVTTLGNTVEALGSANSVVGAAGGVVGTNNGAVDNATSRDSVIAGQNSDEVLTTAGGIAGINTGLVANSQSHSAVIASKTSTYSLGGIVGVNTAKDNIDDNKITAVLDNVNAYGVTGSSILVDNTGGIAGLNSGTLNDAYNESIVKGSSNVGGIAGTNSGEISLIVNGASVTAEGDYTGGLVGSTTGDISDGRNNGVIVGNKYVGGLVGSNGTKDITEITLKNLTNDSSAEIIGNEYVGGIAGSNYGTITAEDQTNLINRGSITGNKYIGGIAGENNGTIANVKNDIVLNAIGSDAMYFGGVTGINKGTITNATNSGNINASGATYVGGITGQNDGILSGAGNSNEGKVTGKDYVGGVAGLNTKNAKITTKDNGNVGDKDNIIVIKNEGEVKAEAGGAGGIFGKNEANIQYAEFVNSGTVTGTAGTTGALSGTGGIFGENTGHIDHSSLKNEVKGNVSGVNNVGGLIGINSGTIEGGRDEASHYYKYQIYNNGTITAENGSNIGGLIGYNKKDTITGKTGSLTAGYNTGNIVAGGSTNVGGIVGTNEGTVKEVFNTIMTADKQNETIVGGSNVGAIIGDNTKGTLTNAYSTELDAYNTKYLVGSDTSLTGNYKIDDNNVWKTYKKGISSTNENGESYDVLKVFLTSVSYDPSKKPDFVYNGNEQSVNISGAIANEMLTDLSGKEFDAHNAAGLMGSNSHKDADIYTDWLYSGQIASSGTGDTFNPNNLGYDIDLATGIKKAQIDITLNDIERIYGSLDIINNGGYGFTCNNDNLTPAMIEELKSLGFSVDSDSALVGDKTKDVGSYTWTGIVTLGSLSSNYELKNDNDGDGSITSTAISKVTPKTLTLKDLLATIVYGNQDNKGLILQKPNNNTDILNGIVYGDDVNINLGNITLDYKNDSAYDQNKGNRVTADVETYEDSLVVGNISLINNENKNYVLDKTTTGGSIQVTPATLTVGLNNVSHKYGAPNLNDYGIDKDKVAGLTNGDEAFEDKLTVTMTKDDALKDNNKHTNDVGDYTWTGSVSGIEGLEKNYNITFKDGQSEVTPASLTVGLNNVSHVYGSPELNSYGISSIEGLTNGDEASKDKVYVTMTKDNALKDNNKHTNDVGDYTWTGSVSGIEGLEKNYNITFKDGQSEVTPASLTVGLNNVSHVYGSPELNSYGISSIEGLTNGDEASKDKVYVTMTKDNALKDNNTHTNNAGGIYTWTGNVSGIEGLENNYIITVNKGQSTVSKADLTIDLNDVNHKYGTPNLNNYGINSITGLTNGDTANIGVTMTEDTALKDNNTHTNNAGGSYTWTGNINGLEGIENNYNITVNNGKSTVDKANLTIDLNDVKHTYGSPNLNDYGINSITGLTNGDTANIGVTMTEDTALKDNNTHTNNAGGIYTWTGNVSGIEGLENNYIITVNKGQSTVSKADLTIDLNDVNHKYGTPNLNNYGINSITGLTNGDTANIGVTMTEDTALKDNNTHTNNAGGIYTWTGNVSGIEGLENNYIITVNKGQSTVSKADLTIDLNDVNHKYGTPNLNNYGINSITGLTNGDKANIGVTMTEDTALKDENTHTNNAGGSYTWTGNISGLEGIENNYNITVNNGKSTVDKANLTIDLNDVKHTYGSPNLNDYGVSSVTGLTNGDKANIGVTMTKDNALKDNNKHTNNAGDYTWTGSVSGIEGLENNYNIKVNDGQSVVNKADLTIDLNENVHHEYGKPNLDDYVITGTDGLTNGDEAFEDKLDVTMTHDDALTDNNTHTKPAGGDYTWTGSVDGIEGLEDNYNITINPGKSTVDKGHLTITVDDSNTTVGDNPNYGGTVDGWANGDNPNDFDINFGLDDDTILDQPGKHDGVIGVIIDGTFYPSGTEDDIFNNYDVTISTGDLTVLKPIDINDYKNWSHLYKDAPWDRNRDFKERKAEFNFVDGAIPLDEAVEEA